jgi:hypothetical protein
VRADDGDGFADGGAFFGAEAGDVAVDLVDEPPDAGDFLVGGVASARAQSSMPGAAAARRSRVRSRSSRWAVRSGR